MSIRLAVFDCDGTLVDSQHAIVAAVHAAWQLAGRDDLPARDAILRIVGLELVESIAQLLPQEPAEVHRQIAEGYKEAWHAGYLAGDEPDAPLYPGTLEALGALEDAGWLLGIATGKGRRGLDATLKDHALEGRFVTLQTADVAAGKPSPDMLHRAMAETGAAPEETVMIGDTTYDMLMAGNAGVAAIGVGWGYHPPEELHAAGAAAVLGAYDELPAAMSAHAGKPKGT